MTSRRQPILFRAESVRGSLGIYLPATVLTRLLGLVRGILLARLISEHEFGLLQIALLAINVLNPICSGGLTEAVARYVPMYETRGRLGPYLARIVPFVLGVSLAISAAVFLAAEPIGQLLFATLHKGGAVVEHATCTRLTRWAAAATFSLAVYFLVVVIVKGLRMFRAVSVLELINNGGFTLATIVAALTGYTTADVMVGCYVATLLVPAVLFAWPLRQAVRAGANSPAEAAPESVDSAQASALIAQLLRFSTWAALAAIMWQTMQYYPMWYLQKVHGPTVTAVFGGVRLLTQMVLVGAMAVIAVVQASVTKTWEAMGRREADHQLLLAHKLSAMLLMVGCAAFALLRAWIMRLFPVSYGAGTAIVSLSLLFFLIGSHLMFLSIHFTLIERARYLFWPWTAGVVVNAVAALVLLKPTQPVPVALQAAAWAGVLGVTAALVTSLVLIRAERRPIDAGVWILLLASYALAAGPFIAASVALLVIIMSMTTSLVLSADERVRGREYMRAALAFVRTRREATDERAAH